MDERPRNRLADVGGAMRARAARADRQFERLKRAALSVDPERLAEAYAWHVLRGIAVRERLRHEKALREFEWGLQGKVREYADAMTDAHNEATRRIDEMSEALNRAWQARKKSGDATAAKDPRMKAARALWERWKAGDLSFRSNAAFARYACETTGLEDASNLARRASEWTREKSVVR